MNYGIIILFDIKGEILKKIYTIGYTAFKIDGIYIYLKKVQYNMCYRCADFSIFTALSGL